MTTVRVQRWPVLERVARPSTGRLTGYRRTAAPLAEREETLIRLESRSRALVTWDIANAATFSLGTGRCIGNADWLLTDESIRVLRKLARKKFPRKKKATPEPDQDVLDKLPIDVGDFAAHDDAPPLPEAYVDKLNNEEGNGAA